MTGNIKVSLKNGIIGLTSEIANLIVQFVLRTITIKYVGVEILGISETFSAALNILNLAESGFQTAIIYYYYKPLRDGDETEINSLLNVLRVVYKIIGFLFIGISIIVMPFIGHLLNGVRISTSTYVIFFLLALNSASSYFLSYKRSLLYASKREYVYKMIDMAVMVIVGLLSILLIMRYKNYILYLILRISQTMISNIIVQYKCQKYYPFVRKEKINWSMLRKIMPDIKHLFVGSFAGYIYGCSDSLIISTMIGTVNVAYLSNYAMITNQLKRLINSFFSISNSIIGNMLLEDNNSQEYKKSFFAFITHIWFVAAIMAIVPIYVLIQGFIQVWVGPQYILSNLVVILLLLDFFISIVQSPCGNFIISSGMFKMSKIADLTGALINIIISIILVFKFGIEGVLVGTVISRVAQWGVRGTIALRKCFSCNAKEQLTYWLKIVYQLLIIFIASVLAKYICSKIIVDIYIYKFLISFIISELIVVAFLLTCFWMFPEQVKLKHILFSWIRKRFTI